MANNYIPLEIQEEIMKRLPAKSLLRFRSVSKLWKSLIHTSTFIADYCVQKDHLLIGYSDTKDEYCTNPKYILIADDDTFPQQKVDLTLPINSSIKLGNGSSHGLLCFSYENMVVLWNPTIRKMVSIDVRDVLDLHYETIFGFGVCPVTFDPKLVKLIFDRHIYWGAYDYLRLPNGLFKRSKMIMSFATTSEEFTEISLPNSLALKAGIRLGLTKLRESLIVVENNPNDQVIGIWMMKNHGDPTSFTKLFNINLAGASMPLVIGFRNSGEGEIFKQGMEVDVGKW
ncbi:putative F-box domain-containing protein [Tanacetum coccineum]